MERKPDLSRTALTHMRRHLAAPLALSARIAGDGAIEVGSSGCRVELSDGRTALDFGSYAVTLLGHRPPAVVAALRHQLDSLPTSSRLLVNSATTTAATTLVEYLGGELPRVYFGLGGADVVEAAVKLARLASGRQRVVAVAGGFHGKSLGALALTHHERFRAGLEPVLRHVTHVPVDEVDTLRRELATGDVAAVVFEPVQGENGVCPLPVARLQEWCALARRHSTFVIVDEIQTGLRRCGDRSVALAAGLPVDAILLGKPLGGGVIPLSAAVCSERLYAPLLADPMVHTSTFSGHPLACAALPPALTAIEALSDRCSTVAEAMLAGLTVIQQRRPDLVGQVRGQGLLWGIDLHAPELAARMVTALARAGLLISPCMGRPATLRLLPPLAIADSELGQALVILTRTLDQCAASGAGSPHLPAESTGS